MNNLSWFLYLAEVVGNIQGVLIALSIFLGIGVVIMGFIFLVTCDCPDDDPHPLAKKWFPRFSLFCTVAALLAAFVPSQQTMYLIAASEAGETVVKSETGQKTIAAINRLLDGIGVKEEEEKK